MLAGKPTTTGVFALITVKAVDTLGLSDTLYFTLYVKDYMPARRDRVT